MASPSTTNLATSKMAGVDDDDDNKALVRSIELEHLGDMVDVAGLGTGAQNYFHRLFSDITFLTKWFFTTWFGVFTSLPNYIFDPFGASIIVVFATASTIVLAILLVVSALWRLPGVQKIYKGICARNGGVGLGNLAYPYIFDSLDQRVREAAFRVMNRPLDTFAQPSSSHERVFDLELAKMLFCCAALVYERDQNAVEEASKITKHAARPGIVEQTLKTSSGMPNTTGQAVLGKLVDADAFIVQNARKWGLLYQSISELATNTSPVCGAFWDPNSNFIILSFKGTDPVEVSEWAIDLSISYVEGGTWLPGYGKVHSGFFGSIFPNDLRVSPFFGWVWQQLHDAYLTVFGAHALDKVERARPFPYEQIRSRVKEIARLLVKNNPDNHVNLFVTGHSLGAALASMFFARAVASPKDFGKNSEGQDLVRVRDAYTFGCPIFGDPDCIGGFGRAVHENLDRPQTLWRVTNFHDPVASSLPEGGDYEQFSHISPTSQFHFAHIGQEIQMRRLNNLVGTGPGTLLPKGSRVKIITHLGGSGAGPDVCLALWCRILLYTPVISRFVSHMPSCYWARLSAVEASDNVPWLGREPILVSL